MFSPASLEAQKIITLSISKLNAVRVTRTGTSMCKSLFVTNLLNEAKKVYYEEEQERAERYAQCRPTTPQVSVTPVCPVSPPVSPQQPCPVNTPSSDNTNRLQCYSDNVSPAPLRNTNTVTTSSSLRNTVTSVTITTTTTAVTSIASTGPSSDVTVSRKRRRVSDQETADAVSSILPKRLRSEVADPTPQGEESEDSLHGRTEEDAADSVDSRLSAQEEGGTSSEDSDSDGEDSASDTSASSSGDEMEVDRITSLVSYFTFAKSKNRSDFCIRPIHQPRSSQILALTA